MHYRILGYVLTIAGGIIGILGLASLFGLSHTIGAVVASLAGFAIGAFLVIFGAVNVSNSRKVSGEPDDPALATAPDTQV